MDVRHYRWNEVPREELNERFARRVITAERVMLAELTLQKGCLVPLHTHENEQLTYVMSGALRFWLGDPAGQPIDVLPGEVLHIPSNLPHRVEALEDTMELDVFSPPRKDWLDRTDSYLQVPSSDPWLSPALKRHAARLIRSYEHWTGQPLVAPGNETESAIRLFEHPALVLSLAEGTTYNYANRTAMNLFERDWKQITNMEGDESAEPHLRQERRERLREALARGCVRGYSNVRISAHGRRFRLEDGTLFAVLDEAGNSCGVAAVISRWHYL